MEMEKPLKLVQVGLGGWGWSWVQVVNESPGWELAAVVDVDAQVRARVSEHYGFPAKYAFSKLNEALQVVDADAALIVVPPEYHADVTIEALESGLHCLVEKPLAGAIPDARRIVEASDRTGKKLMVSQNYRFKRAPQTVRRLVTSGFIGQLGSVFINFQKAPKFSGFRAEMAEPLVTDMAIHHFDQTRGILGLEPVNVRAFSWNPRWSWFKGNATASVLFEMENGAVVSYTGSWVSQGWETTWDGDWRIQGEGGEITWANNEVIIRPSDLFKTVFLKDAVEKNGALHANLVDLPAEERLGSLLEFALSIREDRAPETSGQDNLGSMAMVLGAHLSAKSGQKVLIADVLGGNT
jgi:predicted dehydrogenase